ncbi:hypothetical protein NGA_0182900, partial [Nannochloropsis gaditana CCMP526]
MAYGVDRTRSWRTSVSGRGTSDSTSALFFKPECLWLTLSQGTNARF